MSAAKCGRCGKTGHNRRTCGTAPHQASRPPAVKKGEPASPQPGKLAVEEVWGKLNSTGTAEHKEGASTVKTAEGEENGEFSVDDYETWWRLSGSGRDGKRKADKSPYNQKNPTWTREDTDNVMSILELASCNRDVTPAQAKRFLASFGADAKSALASDKRLPLVFLVALAKDSSSQVRTEIASRTDTPAVVLRLMKGERRKEPAVALAQNVNTPPDILDDLFDRRKEFNGKNYRYYWSEGDVADTLLANPFLPERNVVEGYYSKCPYTSAQALANPQLPFPLLKKSWEDSFKDEPPARTGNSGFGPINYVSNIEKRGYMARNPQMTEEMLDQAVSAGGHFALDYIWMNPCLPEGTALKAWDKITRRGQYKPNPRVIARIAGNINISSAVVDQIDDSWVFPLLKPLLASRRTR